MQFYYWEKVITIMFVLNKANKLTYQTKSILIDTFLVERNGIKMRCSNTVVYV